MRPVGTHSACCDARADTANAVCRHAPPLRRRRRRAGPDNRIIESRGGVRDAPAVGFRSRTTGWAKPRLESGLPLIQIYL
ncbi:hypothetical protein MTO96_000779 [Rhipicephalus appendiculatus]